MDDKVIQDKIQKALELICPLYKDGLITDAYVIGSVAKGTATKESDIDILIINPEFEFYLEQLDPDEWAENIKKVVDRLKNMGVQFRRIEKKDVVIWKFWYELYKDELFHIMPQKVFFNSLPNIQITKDLCD